MLPQNAVKEELSYAYVHAVAARAGCSTDRISKDYDSIDVTLRARVYRSGLVYSTILDLQLKATAKLSITGDSFNYRLPVKNYNDLRRPDRTVPQLLVILI